MLLGLSGAARSGKSSAAQFIEDWGKEEGHLVRQDAFADRLKISAARALGFQGSNEECIDMCNLLKEPGWQVVVVEPEGVGRIEHPISGRSYLQLYGTEAHREVFGQDFWIAAVLDNYIPSEFLIVTDCRFPNEAQAVRDLGGQVWHLSRPNIEIVENEHASERPLPPELVDHVIENDGDLDHFRDLVITQIQGLVYV